MSRIVEGDLRRYLPKEIGRLENPQTDLPRIARDPKLTVPIEAALRGIPTSHDLYLADARKMTFLRPESVHLIVTSPPILDLEGIPAVEGSAGVHC